MEAHIQIQSQEVIQQIQNDNCCQLSSDEFSIKDINTNICTDKASSAETIDESSSIDFKENQEKQKDCKKIDIGIHSVDTLFKLKKKKRNQGNKTKLSKNAINILKQWLIQNINNPYPRPETKELLSNITGLNKKQIQNWFTNSRKRILEPLKKRIQQAKLKEQQENLNQKQVSSYSNAQYLTYLLTKTNFPITQLKPQNFKQFNNASCINSQQYQRDQKINYCPRELGINRNQFQQQINPQRIINQQSQFQPIQQMMFLNNQQNPHGSNQVNIPFKTVVQITNRIPFQQCYPESKQTYQSNNLFTKNITGQLLPPALQILSSIQTNKSINNQKNIFLNIQNPFGSCNDAVKLEEKIQ